MRERFMRIVSVENVSAGKPAPEPYLKALALDSSYARALNVGTELRA